MSEQQDASTVVEEKDLTEAHPPTEKSKDVSFKKLFGSLDYIEKKFVAESLKDADFSRAAKSAGHRYPFDLLARKRVRKALLLAAPYSPLASALLRPYVIEALSRKALSGDANCAKTLLAIKDNQLPKRISYSSNTKEGREPKLPTLPQPSVDD